MAIDGYSCLLWSGDLDDRGDLVDAGWTRGPLPIALPSDSAGRAGTSPQTDREARVQYFAERVHHRLYGEPDRETRRWHIPAGAGCAAPEGGEVEAWELLREDDTRCTLVAHVQLGPEPIRSLAAMTKVPAPADPQFASLPAASPVLLPVRPQVVSHLAWDGPQLPSPQVTTAAASALRHWSTTQQWLWFLASGIAPEDGLPDVEQPDLLDGTVWLSHDWRGLALRDGVAFVATTPRQSSGSFHGRARVYVRSLHVDTMLLGRQQVAAAHRFADEVGQLRVDKISAEAVARLESELFDLRTGLWWTDVTRRGRQASDVLAAYQRQHGLPDLRSKIVQDLTDAARYVQAKQASAIETRRRIEDDRQQTLERLIALVSFVLLPLSIVFGGMALWSDPSPMFFLASLGVGLLLVLLLVVAFPEVRRSLRRPPGS